MDNIEDIKILNNLLFEKYFQEKNIDSKSKKTLYLRNKIVENNLFLVKKATAHFKNNDYKIDIDYINSYGYEGLIKAVENYDMNDCFFDVANTYIKNAIRNVIPKIINFYPAQSYSNFVKCKKVIEEQYFMNTGKKITAEQCSWIKDEIVKLMYLNNMINNVIVTKRMININYPDNIDDYQTLEDDLLDLDLISDKNNQQIINKAFQSLTLKERSVVKLYFGFDDNNPKMQKEIADILKISHQRVSELLKTALDKLQTPKNIKYLKKINY